MKKYQLNNEQLPSFIDHLKKQGTVFAPHKKGDASFSFKKVEDPNTVILDYNRTLNSIKKYFLPPREQLLSFSKRDNSFQKGFIEKEKKIFLGVHSYDMKAVLKLDYNFTQGNPEENYLLHRKNSIFVGVSFTPDEFHFSQSVGIPVHNTEGFDIYLEKNTDGYTVKIITEKGEKLIDGFDTLGKAKDIATNYTQFKNKLKYNYNRLPEVFEQSWNAAVWEEISKKCVGCGTCNLVCPTCYCFDVEDNLDLSLQTGTRDRSWDGCMLNSFAAVAGGENFRKTLAERQRHRVYRKFKYISDITGEPWCVGCGRCTAYCTAGISIVEIVNQLCDIYEQKYLNRPAMAGLNAERL
ncbi:4Fe-4S dicluster domain-containing protein [bacterium]|nr:4Fe-4S dicluster domain-containing protein [bacterium]